MAKLDRFLSHLATKGASSLRMEPGGYPTLEFPGGHRVNLSLQELMGSVLDGLAKEVVPHDQETLYLRGDHVAFPYACEEGSFYLAVLKTSIGTRIVATLAPPPQVPATTPAEAPEQPVAAGPEAKPHVVTGPASVFEVLVAHLVSSGSSDLYLSSDEVPMMRLHGKVKPIEGFPAPRAQDLLDLVKAIAPAKAWDDFQREGSGEFIHVDAGRHCRLRMAIFDDGRGPASSVRVIPDRLPSPSDLGFTDPIKRLSDLTKGLVLFCGAPGSGRTTTVMALLELAARQRQAHILSIESAVEFPLSVEGALIRQRETSGDLPRRKKAIRAAMHQSPDILNLGEIQDPELLELALQSAGTGHLVLGTLPAVSVMDGLEFLCQLAPGEAHHLLRTRLASSLKALVCQALLPGSRGGRVAAFETLFVSPAIAEHLREGRISQIPAAMKSGRAYGQQLMNEALVELIRLKLLEPKVAYDHCLDRESFIQTCKKDGVDFDPRKPKEVQEEIEAAGVGE